MTMEALVIYDSYFGNTEKIAKSISQAIKAELTHIDNCNANNLEGLDYLIVGSPTRGFRPTEKVVTFLRSLPENSLREIKVVAFDTRLDVAKVNNLLLTVLVKIFGYAAGSIEKELLKKELARLQKERAS